MIFMLSAPESEGRFQFTQDDRREKDDLGGGNEIEDPHVASTEM